MNERKNRVQKFPNNLNNLKIDLMCGGHSIIFFWLVVWGWFDGKKRDLSCSFIESMVTSDTLHFKYTFDAPDNNLN